MIAQIAEARHDQQLAGAAVQFRLVVLPSREVRHQRRVQARLQAGLMSVPGLLPTIQPCDFTT